jgi:DNA-3-methyladenine glycosylase I
MAKSLRAKRSNPQMDRHAATRLAMTRCKWVTKDQIYIDYHDKEWGRPVSEDNILFEFIILESFQAGLNWLTILKRRKGFARAFAKFNPRKVAKFTEADVKRLLQDEGIIRHRGKIEAALNNAARFLEVQKEFKSFAGYLEQYRVKKLGEGAALSVSFAKDLKKRGFNFMGATTCYAYMQAVGLVTEHESKCYLAKKNT